MLKNHPSLYQYFSKNQFVNGCTVVISGASSGMGKELVYRYAQRGCNLVIGARRLPELEKIKEECSSKFKNSKIVCVKVDVSVEEEAKALVETAA